MNNIFISYRREDAADVTGRINDRLREHYSEEAIFTDVDNIPFGVDFRTKLDEEVSQCKVLLVVIGKNWLSVKNEKGQRRLDNPADFVRIEIESALKRNIPVIPLLVHGTKMPSADELPESLQQLAFRNGTPIRPDPDFHKDMSRLIDGLDEHLRKYEEEEKRQKANVEAKRKALEEKKRRQTRAKAERQAKEMERRRLEEQKRTKTKDVQRQKAAVQRAPEQLMLEAVDHPMLNELWKCALINIGGVAVGIGAGFLLCILFLGLLDNTFAGPIMVRTLIFFTTTGPSVGAMQSIRLRRYLSNVSRWVLVSLLGWAASGVFVSLLLVFDVLYNDWVTLMIVLTFVGGAVTGVLQTRILMAISSRAYFSWLASMWVWPVSAAICRDFVYRLNAPIMLVAFGGTVCWLVVTTATMAWILTSGKNAANERRAPTKR
jgi:hypothetical protein